MRKIVVFCAVLLATMFSLARTCLADGAIATGQGQYGEQVGGYATNKLTEGEAAAEALRACNSVGQNCSLLRTFRLQCFAISRSADARRLGIAVGPNLRTAEQQSMNSCSSRGNVCVLRASACDTNDGAARPECTLRASSYSLNGPGSVTLYSNSPNATRGYIDHGVGSFSGVNGSGTTYVSQTTTYTATVYNSNGISGNCSTTIVVNQVARPVCNLYANPSILNGPGKVTLNWDSTNAVRGSMDNGVGSLDGVARVISTVSQTTTFNATFYNSVGASGDCSTTVTVNAPPPPEPKCNLSITPDSIKQGSSAAISWTTKDATSFAIDNGVGEVTVVPAGSTYVSPESDTTYTGTADGPGGIATCATSIVVTTPTPQSAPPEVNNPPPNPVVTVEPPVLSNIRKNAVLLALLFFIAATAASVVWMAATHKPDTQSIKRDTSNLPEPENVTTISQEASQGSGKALLSVVVRALIPLIGFLLVLDAFLNGDRSILFTTITIVDPRHW